LPPFHGVGKIKGRAEGFFCHLQPIKKTKGLLTRERDDARSFLQSFSKYSFFFKIY
jgi:hypothetical protein